MPLPLPNRRKSSTVAYLEKKKSMTRQTETTNGTQNKSASNGAMDTMKKSDVPPSMNKHRKSDADKSLYNDAQEKAFGEPYVHEFKEFAGVTIIFRTAPNPKAFGNFDGHGKLGTQAARRRAEFQQSQLSIQDKYEHGDKTDHSGAGYPTLTEVSANNSNETSGNDNQD